MIDRWEGRRGWSPLHATISLGGETTAVVDAYRSPRAPHITITMVYNAVSAKISRGYTGYTPFRVPSPVKNLINRHRGGGLTCTFLLLFFCLPWKKFVRTAIRTIVCNLFESDREVYSNFPASVPHFHIVSTSSPPPFPPPLPPPPLCLSCTSYFQLYSSRSNLSTPGIFAMRRRKEMNFSGYSNDFLYNCNFTSRS